MNAAKARTAAFKAAIRKAITKLRAWLAKAATREGAKAIMRTVVIATAASAFAITYQTANRQERREKTQDQQAQTLREREREIIERERLVIERRTETSIVEVPGPTRFELPVPPTTGAPPTTQPPVVSTPPTPTTSATPTTPTLSPPSAPCILESDEICETVLGVVGGLGIASSRVPGSASPPPYDEAMIALVVLSWPVWLLGRQARLAVSETSVA